MAMSVTSQVLHDGERNVVMQFTGRHDGVGGQEENVVKVDVSQLTPPCAIVHIDRIEYEVSGGILKMLWEEDAPEPFLVLAAVNILDYQVIGGMPNNADPASRTGNILFSTEGFDAGSSYSVVLNMKKKYA